MKSSCFIIRFFNTILVRVSHKKHVKKTQVPADDVELNETCSPVGRDATVDNFGVSRPLLWLAHGGPRLGKSETIQLIQKLFANVLHRSIGIDFQIAALQAVMAERIGQDTLHHCCGIGTGGLKHESTSGQGMKRQSEIVKAVLQWRWLIMEEISMMSS